MYSPPVFWPYGFQVYVFAPWELDAIRYVHRNRRQAAKKARQRAARQRYREGVQRRRAR